jgi:excisionase family DNA binding protein
MNDGRWMSIAEAARRVGVSRQAVHHRIEKRGLALWQWGARRTFVLRSDVEDWIRDRATYIPEAA